MHLLGTSLEVLPWFAVKLVCGLSHIHAHSDGTNHHTHAVEFLRRSRFWLSTPNVVWDKIFVTMMNHHHHQLLLLLLHHIFSAPIFPAGGLVACGMPGD